MNKNRFLLPLIAFITLVFFLAIGLSKDPRNLPSPFIGKSAPAFSLPILQNINKSFSPDNMLGKVWTLNVWASWCVSCRAEHQVLNDFITNYKVNLIGLNYKDKVVDAQAWLHRYGDPYQVNVSDLKGQVGIDWGVYGVPETFVIDKKGIVRLKHTGAVTHDVVSNELVPLIKRLEKEK